MPDSPLDGVRSPLGPKPGGGPPAAFSPTALYSSGAQGIWLDPSDVATMFADRAGTTPVTTPGTVVGLRLDKSKGLTLGADTGTDFSSATGWSLASGISITGGALVFSGVAAGGSAQRTGGTLYTAGVTRVVTIVVTSLSGGTLNINTANAGFTVSAAGTYTARIMGVANNYLAIVAGTGTVTASIDNISVRELPGNHAVAPTDAARPTYGVEPKGGRRNLLTYSELLSNAAWVKTTSPAVTLTDQGSGVWRLQASAGSWLLYQSRASSGTHNFSIEVRSNGAGLDGFSLMLGSSAGGADRTATGDWVRYSASGLSGDIGIIRNSALAAVDVLIRFPQFETGPTATNYQRVLSDYDITESGVATCHYVQYDGSDDSLSTAAIDFTATDKVSIFVGIRKSGTQGSILDFGQPTALGFFSLWTGRPSTDGPTYHFNSGGNIFVTAEAPLNFPSPMNNLLTCLGDISGDRATLRINGTQEAQSTANQGTGNYRTYPLYIGRFNGNFAALNGRDYGIIVVGKTASAGEITDTETWLAARTSGVSI